ncbi:hypothetical protein GDO81_018429 [Engystomops pustulosus]|uniref:Olfactory receptor n=1 Tax=Engystomops pustulosus TaxID=76066 RepID=A0AAV6YWX5_ENGPU|nr:hypothetical protein GDO81_028086 [Engystomops pustulosus]KAG8551066.1 hypothetical protein GDO81_018429 [Engystomops pustulosus]
MENFNQTSQREFILLGLSDVPYIQYICFALFLIMYLITLSGNVLLIVGVWINERLQTPMYFFLSNLSIIDICFSSTIVPRILMNTVSTDRSISLVGCALQMYFHMALGAAECVILAVMAYDRFVAICRPLHYLTIISKKMCIGLASIAWSAGFGGASIHVTLTFQLPFCKSHHLNEIVMYIAAQIIILFAFFLTFISYVRIISTILKIISTQGRDKAFSTCASHLLVVSMYFGPSIFMYLKPRSAQSPEIDKVMSLVYTAVTPMLNPIIYSMRNKDVTDTIKSKLCMISNY